MLLQVYFKNTCAIIQLDPLGGQYESRHRTFDKLTVFAQNMSRFLIVGNSKFPSELITKELIKISDKIIACDGAIERCLQHSIEADYVVGDMDSLEQITIDELLEMNLEVVKLDDQNNNDLSKAINYARDLGAKRIDIIGVEGGSNQHQFASYWSIIDCPIESYIHLQDSIISIINSKSERYSIQVGKNFSVFPVGRCKGVCISGSKWILDNETIFPSSRGLHNIAKEKEIEISCEEGVLLVFRSR